MSGRHGTPQVRRVYRSKADGGAGKPPELFAFYRALHARGESTEGLAQKLNVSGGVVRKLIGMIRRRRGRTWEGLLALLAPEEKQLLLQASESAEWSAAQSAKRPRWSPEKLTTT